MAILSYVYIGILALTVKSYSSMYGVEIRTVTEGY